MKKIRLTLGKYALVDDSDFEWLNQWKWYAIKDHNIYYARRAYKNPSPPPRQKAEIMHRLILGVEGNTKVDHVNHNGLDNQRRNIRVATVSQNTANMRKMRDNKSGYIGVIWKAKVRRWQGVIGITVEGKQKSVSVGYFKSKIKAACARDDKAFELFGEFVSLNFPKRHSKQ